MAAIVSDWYQQWRTPVRKAPSVYDYVTHAPAPLEIPNPQSFLKSDATIVSQQVGSFILSDATIVAKNAAGVRSKVFPDDTFLKGAAWIVIPGGSIQNPSGGLPVYNGTTPPPGGAASDDFLSSALAADSGLYSPVSRFKLDGVNLIITGFSSGVISYQTRTRQWLRRIDVAPGGVLISQETQTKQLATGQIITTLTTTKQVQDTTIITVQTTSSATPGLTTVSVTEKSSTGNQVSREIQVQNILGIKKTTEKKVVLSTPPLTDNVQPIKVVTLDGISHFQWFGAVNPEFAGGEEEGTTFSEHQETIIPGTIDGKSVNAFGQPIRVLVADDDVAKPNGETIHTHTETAGIQSGGTTETDTEVQFTGISKRTITSVKAPDGSTTVTDRTDDLTTGDSVETSTTVETNEFGQITTTVVVAETKTFYDSVLGRNRTTITTTTTVTKGGVVTSEITTTVPDNFDDDIISKKVKVFLILEFTLTCVVDEFTYQNLLEKHFLHQTQFAKLELFGQQLGNANLSYAMRIKLESQFDQALDELKALQFEALGNIYYVVFAPSASAFRAKYVLGAEPHVYELQMILQQRQDLVLGTTGVTIGSPQDSEA